MRRDTLGLRTLCTATWSVASALPLLLAAASCGAGGPGAPGGGPTGDGGVVSCGPRGSNQDVFARLAATCGTCHGAGSARPFFTDLTAFESLLAYAPAYVVRGDPDASALVMLLEGRGTGAFRQMPPTGDDFATLAHAGRTQITPDEVRAWIRALPERPASLDAPDPAAPTTRRLSADEYIRAVQVALGYAPTGGVPPLVLADGVAPLSPDSPAGVDYNDTLRVQMYLMLGGPGYLAQRPAETSWSNSSLIAVTQVAQGACAYAVRARNPQIFHAVRPGARLPADEAAIRANVAYLYQRVLRAAPAPADIDAYVTGVYAPAEHAASPDVGWTQVCTALLRDPLFLAY